MAQLAIKGHETRGKEVIEILEMLGTNNTYQLSGDEDYAYYVIESGEIRTGDNIFGNEPYIMFTLEEFLEKFPYKVGDKAKLDGWPCIITEMSWGYDDVVYSVKGVDFSKRVCSKDLQPYKEETMEETDTMEHTTEINLNHPCFKGCNEIEIIIPDGWEFKQRDNKMFGIRKQSQYPKTVEECAKVLSTLPHTRNGVSGYSSHALWKLQQLLICRDAYWKIAGEQMGLGKPWEPDWDNLSTNHEFIKIIKGCFTFSSRVLVFPTEEMRDAFHENFNDLIEECKEFL